MKLFNKKMIAGMLLLGLGNLLVVFYKTHGQAILLGLASIIAGVYLIFAGKKQQLEDRKNQAER